MDALQVCPSAEYFELREQSEVEVLRALEQQSGDLGVSTVMGIPPNGFQMDGLEWKILL